MQLHNVLVSQAAHDGYPRHRPFPCGRTSLQHHTIGTTPSPSHGRTHSMSHKHMRTHTNDLLALEADGNEVKPQQSLNSSFVS